MKKKIISFAIAAMLVMSSSTTAFAATNITADGGTSTHGVVGNYVAGTVSGTIYSVDIVWSDTVAFTYNGASEGVWDPETHTYSSETEAGWADSNVTITITNHSNIGITATPSYQKDTGFEDVDMIFKNGDDEIANGDGITIATADNGVDGESGTAQTEMITVTPTGTLPEGTKSKKIGTITITINGVTTGDLTLDDDWNDINVGF